jgi:O-antigen/teichoic acid export membrane protein
MSARPRRFLRDIGAQAGANYLSTALRVVRGFMIAAILGPTQMGIVATGNLLLNYTQYSDLGVTLGVSREMPMAFGRQDGDAEDWGWYALVAQVIAGLVVMVVTALWVTSPLSASVSATTKTVLLIAAVASVATGELAALQTIARSRGDFIVSSRGAIVLAVMNLAFGLAGAYFAGAVGVTLGVLLATTIAMGYVWAGVRPSGFRGIRVAKLKTLLSLGLPLVLLTFMGFNLENIDQVMILALLDRTQLGLYSVVIQAGGLMTLTGLSVSAVVGPRLLRRYARYGTLESIRDYTWKPAQALSAVMPVVVCLAWLLGPLAIVWVLPRYVASIAPLRIYMAGMFFLSLNLGMSTTLLALGKHRVNIPIMLGCIVFNVLADIVLVGVLGFGLVGIATASLLTYIVYWTLHMGLVRWLFEQDLLRAARMNVVLVWPGLILVACLIVSAATGRLGRPAPVMDSVFLSVSVMAAFVQLRPLRSDLRLILEERRAH